MNQEHTPRPFALNTLENCRNAIAVLELEKKAYKLKARALALKLAHAERIIKQARRPLQDADTGTAEVGTP
jgi:hypothetical protein